MKHTRRNPSRRRGVAMIETVLALPFFLVILALVIMVGFWMVRLQKATQLSRYEAWRAQAHAAGPHAPPVFADDGSLANFNPGQLRNALYFNDPPNSFQVRRGTAAESGVDLAAALLAEAATADLEQVIQDRVLKRLPNELLTSGVGVLPRSRLVDIRTDHSARSAFQGQFDQDMAHASSRADGDWRYVDDALDLPVEQWFNRAAGAWEPLYASPSGDRPRRVTTAAIAVRDLVINEFDAMVAPFAGGNPIAAMIRDFYLRVPGYRGPKVPTGWRQGDVYTYD